MEQGDKVLWSKGLVLSPQHLQAHDRFLEGLVGAQRWLEFYPWGFRRLEFDREALAGGVVKIVAASGILPDGLAFDVPDADVAPFARRIDDAFLADQTRLLVHFAIPERRPGARNVSPESDGAGTRFRADVVALRDENSGLSERPIEVARKNLKLLAGTESLEGHSTLACARIVRRPGGGYEFDDRFVPPLLDISAADNVVTLTRRLVELLASKSSELSAIRRHRNRGLADFGISDVANFWLLYTVNNHLPGFRHLLDTKRGHPRHLFEAMLSLAGALTAFSPTIQPGDLPRYDHADLAGPLTALDQTLRDLLETVIPLRHLSIALQSTEPTVFSAALDRDECFTAPQVYLAVRSSLAPEELVRKVLQLVKIGSTDDIRRLIRQALPGLRLNHAAKPPGGLPVKQDHQYFVVDQSGEDWDAIRRARALAAFVPDELTEVALELVFVLPRSGPAG